MKLAKLIMPVIAVLVYAGCQASESINVQEFMKVRGWTLVEDSKPVIATTRDVVGVQYYGKGSSVPNCGLITLPVKSGQANFVELVGSEPGENFPQCMEIHSIESFKLSGREYIGIDYEFRETVEDVYRRYYYLYREPERGYIVDKVLNKLVRNFRHLDDKSFSPKISGPMQAARAAHLAAAYPQWRFLATHLISDENSSFNALDNSNTQQCQFVVETENVEVAIQHADFAPGSKCSAIIATTRFENRGTIYYLGMFKAYDGKQLVAVASVSRDGKVTSEIALANNLNKSGATGTIKGARAALAKLLS